MSGDTRIGVLRDAASLRIVVSGIEDLGGRDVEVRVLAGGVCLIAAEGTSLNFDYAKVIELQALLEKALCELERQDAESLG